MVGGRKLEVGWGGSAFYRQCAFGNFFAHTGHYSLYLRHIGMVGKAPSEFAIGVYRHLNFALCLIDAAERH
ncbi:MAG: hypothetical protein BWY75_02476 [bacterium ADurb.Bin425]|nr:MAG: hypothetical protein BWY75_02476 [bacterium ADurb.Bin425]